MKDTNRLTGWLKHEKLALCVGKEMPNLPGFNGGKSRQLERLEFQRGRQISHLNLTAHPGTVQKMNFPPVLSEMDSGEEIHHS